MRTATASARERAIERLRDAKVPEPEASAEVLLSELLEVGRAELPLRREPLATEQEKVYESWIKRRASREPVQRILGHAYFRNLKLKLNKHTLTPRPDTESVVAAALERLDRRGYPCQVLDIGTGSGAVAVSIAQERPLLRVHASDVPEAALEIACRNAEEAGAAVRFHRADIASGLEELAGSVGLLVSNPPYVESAAFEELSPEVRDWDPRPALDGGSDGLSFYRRIFTETPPLLEDGAEAVLEVGDGQVEAVMELGRGAGFTPEGTYPDLTGTPRAVLLRWEGR